MTLFRISALSGALAVILGAMGAHGHVADVITANGLADRWKTASQYHLVHSAVLLFLAWVAHASKPLKIAWVCIAIGVVVFSGSLYVLAYTGMKWLGAITPIGGLSMIVGWAALIMHKMRN
ncbi:MAG: DUF423 domain-containing protein [Verrucomicrobiaceae bacterium]|nr:DUF423 domain-containing protein [Verrucomicrobiaceae bacterium]